MSNIVTQYSRLSHHTITPSGTTFTVPVQEDFTLSPSGWTSTDLALSEIGVNESDNKAYIRIGSNINEILFNESSFSGASNQVGYFDVNGKLTSDSGFTYSLTGATIVNNTISGTSAFQLGGAGSSEGILLTYTDNTDNCSNIIGVLNGTTYGDLPPNSSFMGFTNNNTGDGAFVIATAFSGDPAIYMQTQGSANGVSTTIGITPDLEIVNMTDGNFTGAMDIANTGTSLTYQQTSGGTSSGFMSTTFGTGDTKSMIQSNGVWFNWPTSDGASGSTLSTDGNGNLSFQPIALNGATGGEPTNPYVGQFYLDTSLNVMKFWDSKNWQTITSS